MLPRILNAPWPEAGDLPEAVRAQAAIRIRQYWTVQMGLLIVGLAVLWLTAVNQRTAYGEVYVLPVVLHLCVLVLSLRPRLTIIWLLSMTAVHALQGMLIDGLGGLSAIATILPYTFASMLLAGRVRMAVQIVCVLAFWFNLIYEILPLGPQLEPRRLIFVSYNILIATLTFQTLRFLNRLTIELTTAHVAQEVTARSQQFLARVSHELRTPLNSVLGFAKLVRREQLSPTHALYLQQIVEEGDQLNLLVSDLLDSAHLATGKLRLEPAPCDVNAICAAVADEVRAALRPGVALQTAWAGDVPLIHADPLRLRQIVRNLVGNAAKYTAHGHVALRTTVQDDAVLIAVSDTGAGIPEDQQALIFVPFYKRDNRSAGVGLGLDIARQLARLHGGEITLRSTPGAGSTFTVQLPLRAPHRD
jgi:signal transduction histidine kinase